MYITDGDYIKDTENNDLRNRYKLTKGATQKMNHARQQSITVGAKAAVGPGGLLLAAREVEGVTELCES